MDAFDPEQLMSTRRGPRGDVEVKRWLRSLPDEESFAFTVRCLAFRGNYFQEQRALDLAMSCIGRPPDALAIFRSGLVNPDAGAIKFWLSFAIAKLGGKKVIHEIRSLLKSDPTTADKALYWLPRLLPKNQGAAWELFCAVYQEAKELGVLRAPIMISPPADESN